MDTTELQFLTKLNKDLINFEPALFHNWMGDNFLKLEHNMRVTKIIKDNK